MRSKKGVVDQIAIYRLLFNSSSISLFSTRRLVVNCVDYCRAADKFVTLSLIRYTPCSPMNPGFGFYFNSVLAYFCVSPQHRDPVGPNYPGNFETPYFAKPSRIHHHHARYLVPVDTRASYPFFLIVTLFLRESRGGLTPNYRTKLGY
jgi:hypothetical protein